MKLIMKTSMQGHDIGLTRGDPHDADDAEAIRLIDAGFAQADDAGEEVEARARLAVEAPADDVVGVDADEDDSAEEGDGEDAAEQSADDAAVKQDAEVAKPAAKKKAAK